MKTLSYIGLFLLIQIVSLVLAVVGLPVCAFLALRGTDSLRFAYSVSDTKRAVLVFPDWAWVWSNDEDGVYPGWYHRINYSWSIARVIFTWTAVRNPCNNLRFVRGVSKPGRPLWYWSNGKYYAKAGWEATTGWPSLSLGSGTGF